MASDAPAPAGSFAQVVEAAIAAGLAAALPVLAEAGVTCVDDVQRGPVLAGVPPEHLMQIVEASQGSASAGQSQIATQPWPPRPNALMRRPAVRASFTAGLEAAQLARSSHQPVESGGATQRHGRWTHGPLLEKPSAASAHR